MPRASARGIRFVVLGRCRVRTAPRSPAVRAGRARVAPAPRRSGPRRAILGGMPATFVVVPLWQGSVSARAMSLADGAAAILGDLPSSATVTVDVPVEAGESLGTGVRRYSTIVRVRDAAAEALERVPDWALTIGGDC